ncbi:hypothetical protein JXM67_06335 [candidate division WOR-3 bacterium]|nr:hypothetical protein [candidate division WOR-3 bacterium]
MKYRISPLCLALLLPILLSADGVSVFNSLGSLTFSIEMPVYELSALEDGRTNIRMEGARIENIPGYPRLPVLVYTFALPPGTKAVDVRIDGNRQVIPGEYVIEAAKPQLPRSGSQEVFQALNSLYEENLELVYSGVLRLPTELGRIQSEGECREYSLVTVQLNPFYYDPLSNELSVVRSLTLRIDYEPVSAEHRAFIQTFLDKGTISGDVPASIYNKTQARDWYRPSQRLLATRGLIILTTEKFKSLTDSYVSWKKSTGFHVTVATVEEIQTESEGVDIQQKIRNWLREHVADYEYLLIIGHRWDVPWRILTLFNNNSAPSWVDYDECYPHPSDIYYAGLSEPDSASWNLDQDSYYGETLLKSGAKMPQDVADLDAELYVGRINSMSADRISDILARFRSFEESTDHAYKESSVVVGGILGYYSYVDKWDDSYYMEELLDRDILDRSTAITLYEKEGSNPSEFDCDLAFTQSNLVATLSSNDVGLFVESNHGSEESIIRTVWFDENEDSIPDWEEIENPAGLENSDAPELNIYHPNVAFLLSCLCGHPESPTCFAQALLNYGSVGVVACTRVAWGAEGDWGEPGDGGDYDLCYYFLDNYLHKPEEYDYVLGDALAQARSRYWSESMWMGDFCNVYGYNFFGDPSLRHFGHVSIEESPPEMLPMTLEIDENHTVSFGIPKAGQIELYAWDVAGRRVQKLCHGNMPQGHHVISWDTSGLPSGSYFVTLDASGNKKVVKTVVLR